MATGTRSVFQVVQEESVLDLSTHSGLLTPPPPPPLFSRALAVAV